MINYSDYSEAVTDYWPLPCPEVTTIPSLSLSSDAESPPHPLIHPSIVNKAKLSLSKVVMSQADDHIDGASDNEGDI